MRSVAAAFLNSPKAGPVPDPHSKGFKRLERNLLKLYRLGKLYRKQTPKEKRSFLCWCKFLQKKAPEFLGKAK